MKELAKTIKLFIDEYKKSCVTQRRQAEESDDDETMAYFDGALNMISKIESVLTQIFSLVAEIERKNE